MKTNPLDPTLRYLNDAGCCAGARAQTPVAIENRPGLSAVAFRAGTHARFKASLLAALSDSERARLGDLCTRENDDFTIALLDGFAAMADVLTFYSERIANEGFLRTATERRSVLELARAIGYELRPGAAAGAWLAFTVEDAPGAPGQTTIPKGTKVQSVPGPNEKPQVYETVEGFEARKEWNDLKPLSRKWIEPFLGQKRIYLQGVSTNLKPGDAVLIVGDERLNNATKENWDFRRVIAVQAVPDPDATKAFTAVTLHEPLGKTEEYLDKQGKKQERHTDPAREHARVYAMRTRASLFGHNAPDWRTLPAAVQEKYGGAGGERLQDWPVSLHTWFQVVADQEYRFHLDAIYPSATRFTWAVVSTPGYEEIFQILEAVEDSQTGFAMSTKCTRLKVKGENLNREEFSGPGIWRKVSVFLQGEELSWAAAPILLPMQGDSVELSQAVPSLQANRRLIVRGKRLRATPREGKVTLQLTDRTEREISKGTEFAVLSGPGDPPPQGAGPWWRFLLSDGAIGVMSAESKDLKMLETLPAGADDSWLIEQATLKSATMSDGRRTILEFTESLKNSYDPATVSIFANVALATHGETVEEIIGSGDASQPHQHFGLRQTTRETPLTFTPANTPTGSEASLDVFVDDVKWAEAGSLYARGPRERVFVSRRQDDGTTRLTFGDGRFGSLLPTGQENIRARYRRGIGLAGQVKPGQLSLLMTRPLGVQAVTNPMASSGAQDPESLDDARRNAPLQTLTLGRIVSLQDYEDFARAFSGVAKAHATWVWTPRGRGVFVTVVLPGGREPPPTDTTLERLAGALREFGNRLVPVRVALGSVARLALAGDVIAKADRIPERVGAAVETVLRRQLGFEARELGRDVAFSEVIALIQGVPGVASVRLTQFMFAQRPEDPPLSTILAATRPSPGGAIDSASPAEVLVLDEASLSALKVIHA